MSIPISIPSTPNPIELQLSPGETLYVLGANGVGKSALLHHLNRRLGSHARWISSLRRNWLQSSGSNLTPMSKAQNEENLMSFEGREDSRWVDHNPDLRPNIAIFDLIQRRSMINDEIASAVRTGRDTEARSVAEAKEDPLEALSELMRSANLHFDFSVDRNSAIVAHKHETASYSAAEMSDGERNALLLAAEVLTVPSGTLILVDEPELHLHRAIIEPLLNGLFSKRSDCAFVISTHEVMLPFDNPNSKILLLRGCTYQDSSAISWNADLLASHSDIDEDIKKDILGGRRDILFTEGETSKLDQALYARIFPDVSVVAKGSRRNVENAVKGIRSSQELHWLNAYGIVDGDGLAGEEVEQLRHNYIYPIPCYAVESLYYDPFIQKAVANKRSELTGADPEERLENAKLRALVSVESHEDRLSELIARRRLRETVLSYLPNSERPFSDYRGSFDFDAQQLLRNAHHEFRDALDTGDLKTIIRRYPIKETPIPQRVATSLGFDGPAEYEMAVRKLLDDDDRVLAHIHSILGDCVIPNGSRVDLEAGSKNPG